MTIKTKLKTLIIPVLMKCSPTDIILFTAIMKMSNADLEREITVEEFQAELQNVTNEFGIKGNIQVEVIKLNKPNFG